MTAAERCRTKNAESWAEEMSADRLQAWTDLLAADVVRIALSIGECDAEFEEHVAAVKNGNPSHGFARDDGPEYYEYEYPEDLEITRELLVAAHMAARIQKRTADPGRRGGARKRTRDGRGRFAK